jgi:hypothetical protein
MTRSARPLLLACLAMVLLGVPAARAQEPVDPAPAVRLHPALGDTLRPPELARLDLFQDVEGLRAVVFHPAPWGGYMARLVIGRGGALEVRERNVPSRQWQAWREQAEQILSDRTETPPAPASPAPPAVAPAPAETDTLPPAAPTRLRVWPEVPLPPQRPRVLPADSVILSLPSLDRHWYLLLEVGYRRNITDFREFFTDMGMLAMTTGYLYGPVMPFFAMEFGFGDLQDDFEGLAGDGRANTYSFSFGLLGRAPLSDRTAFYLSGSYGYFIRSLQWGGVFYNPRLNTYSNGVVLEQQDWGLGLRAGVQIQRRTRGKARFYDIGVGLQTSVAQEWNFYDADRSFRADDRDTWLTLSIRFGESL